MAHKLHLLLPYSQVLSLCLLIALTLHSYSPIRASTDQFRQAESHARFTENKGQWPAHVEYTLDFTNGRLFMENNQLTYLFHSGEDLHRLYHGHKDSSQKQNKPADQELASHAFQVHFPGADKDPNMEDHYPFKDIENFYRSKDTSRWATGVRSYQEVTYRDLYDGVDLRFEGEGENLKYTFTVAPGKKPAKIEMVYKGLSDMQLDDDGRLQLQTSVNHIKEKQPYAYQVIDGEKVEVPCEFKLDSNRVNFILPSGYDKSKRLIIDPVLVFSTYTGSTADNWGYTATYDTLGIGYSGGIAFNPGYPTTTGAFQTSFAGGNPGPFNYRSGIDAAITKYNQDGSTRLYSTYLGGSRNDQPQSMFVNTNNELIVFGSTESPDFPVTANAYDTTFGGGDSVIVSNVLQYVGSDIFISKFSVDGTNLLGSTYLGGSGIDGLNAGNPDTGNNLLYNYADHARGEVIADESDAIYIASTTRSTDFPVTSNAVQVLPGGGQDGCVAKLSSDLSTLIWSSFLGGSRDDAAYSVKLDSDGRPIVCGGTKSLNFPGMSGLNNSYQGGVADGFLVRLSNTGDAFLGGTYLGTSNYDQAYLIDLDVFDNVFVYGQTLGNYPVSAGVYNNPNSTQFVHKLSPDLSTTEFSTVVGRGADTSVTLSPTAFLVDVCENIYLSGWGGEVNAGSGSGSNGSGGNLGFTQGMPVTANAFQQTSDGSDFHVMVLGKDAQSLRYGSYFGGSGPNGEHVDGGTSRFDENGVIYQAVCAGCGGTNIFPTTPGVVSQTNNSTNCNLALFKYDIELARVEVDVEPLPDDTGCVPYTVQFVDNGFNSRDYAWDFGDGTTSTDSMPVHTYTDTGKYNVSLIGLDSVSCSGITFRDTSIATIVVDDDSISASFTDSIISDCENYTVDFTNTSLTASNNTEYFWQFGDGDTSTMPSPTHTYDSGGTYYPQLMIYDSTSCTKVDEVVDTLRFKRTLEADFAVNDTAGCLPFTAEFTDSSTTYGNPSYQWTFGDGDTSNLPSPGHLYDSLGTFPVTLVVEDSSTCNITDTASTSIDVVTDSITAGLTKNILQRTCDSLTIEFQNQSTGAFSYTWDFGNGDSSNATSPVYSYTNPGTYNITLIANKPTGCNNKDTATTTVTLLPEVEAFSSLQDTGGCTPLTLTFQADSVNPYADSTYWLLNDTLLSQSPSVTKTFTDSGTYNASFIALDQDSITCNLSDTASLTININNDSVQANFDLTAPNTCDSLPITLDNLSQGATSYVWTFDGSDTSQQFEPNYTFTKQGTREVKLIAANPSYCYPNDTAVETTKLKPRVQANQQLSDTTGCLPFTIDLKGNGLNADSLYWMVDDSIVSDTAVTSYTFTDTGSFSVGFHTIDTDSSTCNMRDTSSFTVTVENDSVKAGFTITDPNTCDSLPISVTNNSQNASSYIWNFGDNTLSTDFEPNHTYFVQDTYQVSLISVNLNACYQRDTATQEVSFLPRVSADPVLDGVLCPPFSVSFDSIGNNAQDYLWDFGDGTTDTIADPTHTYQDTGTYYGSVIVSNPRACNFADTTTFKFIASDDTVKADFIADYPKQCDSLPVSLINQSRNATDYLWSFGDGDSSTLVEPSKTYQQAGDYWLTLEASNDSVCVARDTTRRKVSLKPRVRADYIPPQNACVPLDTTFTNTSSNGKEYFWNFGDGTTSQEESPSHAYTSEGDYDVTLVTKNDSSCNIADTATSSVQVYATPLARFEPDTSVKRVFNEVDFDNQSQGGNTYQWAFGDGSASSLFEPSHQYDKKGTYEVCLTTTTEEGCPDTYCDTIRTIFEARVDVPNAFSPNDDGTNDKLYVEGYGIESIEFKVYNRWGEKVFESNDLDNGWDGTYKGKKQEMEVYVYTLEATFLNGETTTQKGNITLLR